MKTLYINAEIRGDSSFIVLVCRATAACGNVLKLSLKCQVWGVNNVHGVC